MGQKIMHLGPAGAGAAMKVVLNAVLAVINEAIAEGLVLAERSGIERETAYDVFAGGVVAAPYVLYKREAFVRPEEAPVAFTIDLMRKDLGSRSLSPRSSASPSRRFAPPTTCSRGRTGRPTSRAWPTSSASTLRESRRFNRRRAPPLFGGGALDVGERDSRRTHS